MGSVISFVTSHEVLLAATVVAVLDFLFAISPGIQSNGILHAVYGWLKGIVSPPPAATPGK